MFFRMPRFIRRYIRNRMHPMAEHKAMHIKTKISILYAFIAWNAGGYVLYQISKGNRSWPKTVGIRSEEEDIVRPAIAWAHALGVPKGQVIRISNRGQISPAEPFELDIDSPEIKMITPTPTPPATSTPTPTPTKIVPKTSDSS